MVRKDFSMYKNKITMNCIRYINCKITWPKCCYACGNRDGYPQNLGGDKNCKNFTLGYMEDTNGTRNDQ